MNKWKDVNTYYEIFIYILSLVYWDYLYQEFYYIFYILILFQKSSWCWDWKRTSVPRRSCTCGGCRRRQGWLFPSSVFDLACPCQSRIKFGCCHHKPLYHLVRHHTFGESLCSQVYWFLRSSFELCGHWIVV